MEATSTPITTRSQRRQQQEPKTAEQPASEGLAASVAAQDGDQGDTSAPPTNGAAEQTQERRRRERQPKVIEGAPEVGDKIKVALWLPAEIAWQLDHLEADTPGRTKGEIVAPWLAEQLKGHDYPKRPDWLLAVLQRRREREAAKVVSAN